MPPGSLEKEMKDAVAKAFRQNRDALRDLLAEVIEDVSMSSAIREGLKIKPATRQAVMNALHRRK